MFSTRSETSWVFATVLVIALLVLSMSLLDAAPIGPLGGHIGGPTTLAATNDRDAVVVTAVGEADLIGDELVLRTLVTEESDVAADALDAFVDARRRAIAAFTATGIEGLEIRGLGMRITYNAPVEEQNNRGVMMMGMEMDIFEGVRCSEDLEIAVSGLAGRSDDDWRTLVASLVDAALDAGVVLPEGEMNPQLALMMRLYGGEVPESIELASVGGGRAAAEQGAFAGAMREARRRAQAIASETGRSLGEVRRVETLEVAADSAVLTYGGRVRVELRVEFVLE